RPTARASSPAARTARCGCGRSTASRRPSPSRATTAGFRASRSRPTARIVSGGADGTVRLWALDGKPAAEPFNGHERGVRSVAFSPDGTRIVSGGLDGTVRLWTLDGKPAAEPFKGHDRWVSSVAFSPDGTRIVSGGADGTVRLWRLPSGKG